MNKHIDITGVVLATDRLTLRPWRESDLNDLYEYASVDGVGQMAGWVPHRNIEESGMILESFIKDKKTFALEYQGKVIGSLGIEEYSEENYPELAGLQGREIGYVLSKDYWGQGLMPEAVKAVISWLFDKEKLDFIIVGHFDWNNQSRRVVEKSGFRYIKTNKFETRYNTVENAVEYILHHPERKPAVYYPNMHPGVFQSRPNRFIAHVEIDGREEIVHVKNTGRCKELLPPGVKVWCQKSDNPNRKTKYDLITVRKGDRLINMDSQAPNIAAGEWLRRGGLGAIENLKAETVHGDSRFDFSFTLDGKQCFLEVKGVTLENDGVCAFPDAPTERGTKHLKGLTEAARQGYGAFVLFVIQMADVKYLCPNDGTDPAFGAALREAAGSGVTVLAMDCGVSEDSMEIRLPVLVKL